MNIQKIMLVLCLGFSSSVGAAGFIGEGRAADDTQKTSSCCHDVVMDSLIIYQPDDALLRNYAPYQKRIRALFAYLATHPTVGLRLEGSADGRKSSEYSFALGQTYADSVQKYLVSQGFDSARIIAVSYGKEKLVDSGHNRKAWARNRRVEIKLPLMD